MSLFLVKTVPPNYTSIVTETLKENVLTGVFTDLDIYSALWIYMTKMKI